MASDLQAVVDKVSGDPFDLPGEDLQALFEPEAVQEVVPVEAVGEGQRSGAIERFS
jgi:hypothetical protein